MSTLIKPLFNNTTIDQEITHHPAWLGRVSGLIADKMLRGKKQPFLYVLRAGENELDYYVSFILPDFSIKHQPFTITLSDHGWYYENSNGGGPYTTNTGIDDVLHLIMHCDKNACIPFIS